MTTLTHQTAHGVKWSGVSQVGRQGTQLLTTIILARLLTPSDFGLIGMAMVVIGFIGIFKDLGTSAAIIQHKELSESLLSSIFWVNTGFGALAMGVLYWGAPLGGLIYHEYRVIPVVRILSLSFIISGISILQQAIMERSFAFRSLAKIEITAVTCSSVVGVGLAFLGAGVWSLVYQSLTAVSVTTILLWLSCPWRPKWVFDWKEVKSVSNYSLNLVGFTTFNYFIRNMDYLLIGRYLGALELGYYTLAYRILLFPLQNISGVIGRVMFPIYSSIQDDNYRFCRAYLKVAATIGLITFPMMIGLIAVAKPFILTIFGPNWQPVILLIMILAPVGMWQSVGTTVGAIYTAKGRTDWLFRWGVGAGLFVVTAFIIGLNWGIVGVAAAYSIATTIILYPSFAIPFRLIDLQFTRLVVVLFWPFINSLIMFGAVIGLNVILPATLSNAAALCLSIALGIIVYSIATWINNREQLQELWSLLRFKRKG